MALGWVKAVRGRGYCLEMPGLTLRPLSLAMVAILSCAAVAQAPRFEAASVKPNPSRTGVRGHSFPGDRFEAKNVPLRDLIMIAYGQPGQLLTEAEMAGGPDWIDADRFDVSATVGAGPNGVALKQLML